MTTTSIPLGDAPALRRFTKRTRAMRTGLAVVVVLFALLAVAFAHPSANRSTPLLPAGSDGIVVLDLSASAGSSEYALIAQYLDELVRSNGRFGLVVFSDTAYEALPPNTPAQSLSTLTRYYRPPYPTNPWSAGFSLGTSISKGLDLAENVLLADGVRRRAVWLISDLSDAGGDRQALAHSLQSYVSSGIALHVLPVEAARRDLAPYERLFGTQSPTIRLRPLSLAPPGRTSYAFPLAFAIVAAVLAVVLAVNELLSTPLRWGHVRGEVVG
jgi:hypothetical protein